MHYMILLLSLALSTPAAAQMPPDPIGQHAGLAEAIERTRNGQWLAAEDAAERAGPVAGDVIEWMWLRQGSGDFETALAFLERNPDWPGLARLRQTAEKFLPAVPAGEEQARKILRFFGEASPDTGNGTLALINAHRLLGQEGDARAEAAIAWLERSMTGATETALLALYPDALGPLEAKRADRMFWMDAGSALSRSVERLSGVERQVAAARLAALNGGDPQELAAKLPSSRRNDPGLAYRTFRQLLSRDRESAAIALLRRHSTSAEALGDPEAWASQRRDLARQKMRAGDNETAYELASKNWLTEGSVYTDLEWIAGYVALTRLDRAEDALAHFHKLRKGVFTPISLGRAFYWIGRGSEALDRPGEALAAYRLGARHQTSFYGLLAAEKAGLGIDPQLVDKGPSRPLAETSFNGSSVLEAALLLQAAGERDLAQVFFTHLAENLDPEEAATLGDLVLELGEPYLAVKLAKGAAQNGVVIPRAYFPVVDLGQEELPVSEELALAIARRESEFNPVVSSGVGAGGLMQLMPGTAQDVTRELGITYSRDRLFADPSYNARLGTAYLAGLERRFGQNPVLVSAGYNAGPGRPLSWMRERGDPREPDVDVIDWIEMIPFEETRNYVMRVSESLPVYRARLGRPDERIRLTEELKGR